MARDNDPDQPVVVATSATEVGGEELVSVIRAAGIDAMVIGAMTAGFRAEAPGIVKIMVRRADASGAAAALRQAGADAASVVWSDVDVGEGEASQGDNAPTGSNRVAWTVVLAVMLPLGLVLTTTLSTSTSASAATRAIGPILLATCAIMLTWLFTSARAEEGEDRA
ncbi:MAG: hypothetical protein KF745_08780 [Phycisphaeraceae bacterium]|nr:hypothetical protein [Phycisphaeraceae bacterium]